MRNILIVGGTGLVGAQTALHLREAGHRVTLMSRQAPALDCLSGFDHLAANYLDDRQLPDAALGQFDALVFAAAADLRQLPRGADEAEFYSRANSAGVPNFFECARAAGIQCAVYVGTFYPQLAPKAIETSAYVRSRHLADTGIRSLSSRSFRVCSLNAPFILGHLPGMDLPHLAALVQYAKGALEGVPVVAPAGGVNHISSQSIAEAISGALDRGEGGKAYLVGDENLSWKAYLELYFQAAGRPTDLPVSTEEHPLFPDLMLYAGRNATVHYEPEGGEFGYGRNQVRGTIAELVRAYG